MRHKPEFVRGLVRVLGPVNKKAFRYELRGLERVPPPPCLFVGNHSGLGVVEILCMLTSWYEAFGDERPVLGLAHDFLFRVPVLASVMRGIGAVPASSEAAHEALAGGRDVLVFPGGERDAARPFYEANRVDFGARRGYVRIAREARVPIVPVATIGSHRTYTMAPGGDFLARSLGLKKLLRVERVPLPTGWIVGTAAAGAAVAGALPGWAGGLAFALGWLPNPVHVTTELLPPVRVTDDADVEEVHRLVHGALQDAVQQVSGEERGVSPSSRARPPASSTTRASARRSASARWGRRSGRSRARPSHP